MTYHALIPAAGVGQRMGATVPKQYLKIAGKTVLDWTIERLLAHPLINSITLSLATDDSWWQHSLYAQAENIHVAAGGKERCDSVLNGLHDLAQRAAAKDWVLVHDAARPCVRLDDISKLIDTVTSQGIGGLLGMPVRDSMKRVTSGVGVNLTPTPLLQNSIDRNHLWHAFTPQMFQLGQLKDALQGALKADVNITDEASAMQWAGHQAMMIEGQGDNIKITHPSDLALAEFYLKS